MPSKKSTPYEAIHSRGKGSAVQSKRSAGKKRPVPWPEGKSLALVKIPPSEIDTTARHTAILLEGEVPHLIGTRMRQFLENKNPVYAIECFVLSMKAGVYPPADVLDWLQGVFEHYHGANGNVDMDLCMGLKKQGAGAFKQVAMEDLHSRLCLDIAFLRALGVSKAAALSMVFERFKSTDEWNQTRFDFDIGTEDYLDKIYKGTIFVSEDFKEFARAHVGEWALEEKRRFLADFPKEQLAADVRNFINNLCN